MLTSAKISETLEVAYDDQERVVEIDRWPESFGKWSNYAPLDSLVLTPEEAVALRDHLNIIVAERGF